MWRLRFVRMEGADKIILYHYFILYNCSWLCANILLVNRHDFDCQPRFFIRANAVPRPGSAGMMASRYPLPMCLWFMFSWSTRWVGLGANVQETMFCSPKDRCFLQFFPVRTNYGINVFKLVLFDTRNWPTSWVCFKIGYPKICQYYRHFLFWQCRKNSSWESKYERY